MATPVTVAVDKTNLQVTVGPQYGFVRVYDIDLTDSRMIAEGVIRIVADECGRLSNQIGSLVKRIEALEKVLATSKENPNIGTRTKQL